MRKSNIGRILTSVNIDNYEEWQELSTTSNSWLKFDALNGRYFGIPD